MMRFIGVDLAWGDRKPSAAVVLESEKDTPAHAVNFSSGLDEVGAIGDFILSQATGPAVIGIDAPLVVPNASGGRACDESCAAKWGAFQAEAPPANQRQCGNPTRGGRLVAKFEGAGFHLDHDFPPRKETRAVFEILPQPASVALLGLKRAYKFKRSATAQHQKELALYQKALIGSLERLDPAVYLEGELRGRLRRNPAQLKGEEFERQADLVDALMCAVAVYHAWYWGEEKWETAGKLEEGAILLPRAESYLAARGA